MPNLKITFNLVKIMTFKEVVSYLKVTAKKIYYILLESLISPFIFRTVCCFHHVEIEWTTRWQVKNSI